MIGRRTEMAKRISAHYATEEDYKKLNFYSVGTLHRASTLPVTEPSSGKDEKKDSQQNLKAQSQPQ
jgi:hypothetical protein